MKRGQFVALAILIAAPLEAQVQSGPGMPAQSSGPARAADSIDCNALALRPVKPAAPPSPPVYGPAAPRAESVLSPEEQFCADQAARRDRETRARFGLGPSTAGTTAAPTTTPPADRHRECKQEPDGSKRCVWSSSSDPNQSDADNPARREVNRLLDGMTTPN